jgi:small-conductance mechanosensitive channel
MRRLRMSNDPMYNGSGCKDPTAGNAIIHISREEKYRHKRMRSKLSNYPYTCQSIITLQKDIKLLGDLVKAERDTSKAICSSGSESQRSNNISDPTAQAIIKIIDRYEEQIKYAEQRLKALYDDKNAVEKIMDKLSVKHKKLIELRYFKGYHFWQIAKLMNYDERHCKRLDREIIELL